MPVAKSCVFVLLKKPLNSVCNSDCRKHNWNSVYLFGVFGTSMCQITNSLLLVNDCGNA